MFALDASGRDLPILIILTTLANVGNLVKAVMRERLPRMFPLERATLGVGPAGNDGEGNLRSL